MKTTILFIITILCSILLTLSVKAQREIRFSYDNSGNMTSRTIYIHTPPAIEAADTDNSPVDTEDENDTKTEEEKVFKDIIGNQYIKIYPNPTTGKLVVEIPNYINNSKDRIDIVDMQGTLRQRVSPLEASNTIILNSLPAATYIILIQIDGETTQWKIIKQ